MSHDQKKTKMQVLWWVDSGLESTGKSKRRPRKFPLDQANGPPSDQLVATSLRAEQKERSQKEGEEERETEYEAAILVEGVFYSFV